MLSTIKYTKLLNSNHSKTQKHTRNVIFFTWIKQTKLMDIGRVCATGKRMIMSAKFSIFVNRDKASLQSSIIS